MHTTEEKIGFSRRLKAALKAGAPKAITVNAITIQFNLRYKGEPVSTQAIHRWLNAQAIPASDKVETLVKWLGVTKEWLKYGHNEQVNSQRLSTNAHLLLARFDRLSERQQFLILELLNTITPE
jgi:HTH-type transcriptional regulator, cell division transcriptional repressor